MTDRIGIVYEDGKFYKKTKSTTLSYNNVQLVI